MLKLPVKQVLLQFHFATAVLEMVLVPVGNHAVNARSWQDISSSPTVSRTDHNFGMVS